MLWFILGVVVGVVGTVTVPILLKKLTTKMESL